jgi:glycosyltransferase involved in cell wall biosynthesis
MRIVFFELEDINWYPSATPYQRAKALSGLGQVYLLGPSVSIAGELRSKVRILQVSAPSYRQPLRDLGFVTHARLDSYCSAVENVLSDLDCPIWVCSTTIEGQTIAAGLHDHFGGFILVDVFDPIELPREIAKLKNQWTRAIWHWIKEKRSIRLMRKAHLVVQATGLDLAKSYGIDADRVVKVLNGVRPSLLEHHLKEKANQVRESPHGKMRLGYVGQLAAKRGLAFFCDVTRSLRDKGAPIEVVMVGPISRRDNLKLKAQYDPEGCWLKFTGPLSVEDAMGVLETCAILVDFRPDTYAIRRQFPIKIGEYLALGKPILANDLPGTREMVGSELAQLLLPPGDKSSWIGAIENFRHQSAEARRIGLVCQTRAAEITWPKVHSELLDRLQKLVSAD